MSVHASPETGRTSTSSHDSGHSSELPVIDTKNDNVTVAQLRMFLEESRQANEKLKKNHQKSSNDVVKWMMEARVIKSEASAEISRIKKLYEDTQGKYDVILENNLEKSKKVDQLMEQLQKATSIIEGLTPQPSASDAKKLPQVANAIQWKYANLQDEHARLTASHEKLKSKCDNLDIELSMTKAKLDMNQPAVSEEEIRRLKEVEANSSKMILEANQRSTESEALEVQLRAEIKDLRERNEKLSAQVWKLERAGERRSGSPRRSDDSRKRSRWESPEGGRRERSHSSHCESCEDKKETIKKLEKEVEERKKTNEALERDRWRVQAQLDKKLPVDVQFDLNQARTALILKEGRITKLQERLEIEERKTKEAEQKAKANDNKQRDSLMTSMQMQTILLQDKDKLIADLEKKLTDLEKEMRVTTETNQLLATLKDEDTARELVSARKEIENLKSELDNRKASKRAEEEHVSPIETPPPFMLQATASTPTEQERRFRAKFKPAFDSSPMKDNKEKRYQEKLSQKMNKLGSRY